MTCLLHNPLKDRTDPNGDCSKGTSKLSEKSVNTRVGQSVHLSSEILLLVASHLDESFSFPDPARLPAGYALLFSVLFPAENEKPLTEFDR